MHGQDLVSFLKYCAQKGWMPGTTGGMAQLVSIGNNSKKILVTPDNVCKDDLSASDVFTLRDLYGSQELIPPISKNKPLQISSWAPLFLEILARFPNVTCVGEFATKWSTLASRMAFKAWQRNAEAFPNVLRLSYWGLLKHLGTEQELLLPIIEGLADPSSLHDALRQQLSLYPSCRAVLIRNYGMLVWGESLTDLKNNVELIEHLCELQVTDFNLLR